MNKGAIIDSSGQYRYLLWRTWEVNLPVLAFVMLNPSTADADVEDPTIRRCIGFAKDWGYGGIEVVNLFALRATDPAELRRCTDPVGPDNDGYILAAAEKANKIIFAWGTKGSYLDRDKHVHSLLASLNPICLQMTRDWHPSHPLYVKSETTPILYERKPS